MSMSPSQQLDALLHYIGENGKQFKSLGTILDDNQELGTEQEIQGVLYQLMSDEHVVFDERPAFGSRTYEGYFLTFHGRRFLERGGYMNEARIERRRAIWMVAKIVAATLNAIMIILISAIGLYVSTLPKDGVLQAEVRDIDSRTQALYERIIYLEQERKDTSTTP